MKNYPQAPMRIIPQNGDNFDYKELEILYRLLTLKAEIKASAEEFNKRRDAGALDRHFVRSFNHYLNKTAVIISDINMIPMMKFYHRHNYFMPEKHISTLFLS